MLPKKLETICSRTREAWHQMIGKRIFFLLILLGLALAGCGGASKSDQTAADVVEARKSEPIKWQTCEGDSERDVDVNNDGRPDIRHVMDDNKEVCTEIDMNFDGHIDVKRFYTAGSSVIDRDQYDFDFDGTPDQNDFYKNGKLDRKEMDTISTERWTPGFGAMDLMYRG